MIVNVINKSNYDLPAYATEQSAGMDLRANIDEPIVLKAHCSAVVGTGIHIGLPEGCEAQVRGRSGLAFKYDIISHVGTIDADYIGEIHVKLFNLSNADYVIYPGERISQLVINKIEHIEWNEVTELETTERGEGGFGHTGKN